MSNATKITGRDPGKPSITDEKSDTNVPGDNKGRGYGSSTFFVIIALIVLALTILFASRTSCDNKHDCQRLIMYILIMFLCAFIILRLGAVHWAFIAVLIILFVFSTMVFLLATAFSDFEGFLRILRGDFEGF